MGAVNNRVGSGCAARPSLRVGAAAGHGQRPGPLLHGELGKRRRRRAARRSLAPPCPGAVGWCLTPSRAFVSRGRLWRSLLRRGVAAGRLPPPPPGPSEPRAAAVPAPVPRGRALSPASCRRRALGRAPAVAGRPRRGSPPVPGGLPKPFRWGDEELRA